MTVFVHLRAAALACELKEHVAAGLGGHAAQLVDAEDMDEDNWYAAIAESDLVVFWIDRYAIARRDATVSTPSVMRVLTWISELGRPAVAIGHGLDAQLYELLTRHRIRGFVAQTAPTYFEESLALALRHVIADRDGEGMRAFNVVTRMRINVTPSSTTWSSSGGYHDSLVRRGAADWAPLLLAEVREAARPETDTLLRRRQFERIGNHLGTHLLPDEEAKKIYRRINTVASTSASVDVQISTIDEWTSLPFELARLSAEGPRLGQIHPVTRRVNGLACPSSPGCQPNGLRVLLVASAAGGTIRCPRSCERSHGCELPSLDQVRDEVEKIRLLFEEANQRSPGLLAKLVVLRDDELSSENLRRTLAEHTWDVFHYAGHGVCCERNGALGACLFAAGVVVPTALSSETILHAIDQECWIGNFVRYANDGLVYLSCCRGVDSSLAITAARHASCHIIGFAHEVDDEAASRLAGHFYTGFVRALEAGKANIGEQLLDARIRMLGGSADEWLSGGFCTLCRGSGIDSHDEGG